MKMNRNMAMYKLTKSARVLTLIVMLATVLCMSCMAQSVQFYGGYNYQRLNPSWGEPSSLNGWTSGVELGFPHLPLLTPRLSLVADVSGIYTTQGGVNLHQYTYLGGPRVSQKLWRLRTFEHVMLGNVQLNASLGDQSDSTSSFATAIGGGADFRLTKHLSIRPLQADYLLTHDAHNVQNNFRYSSGLVWSPK